MISQPWFKKERQSE